jgi:metallo-beta-lactamase class B
MDNLYYVGTEDIASYLIVTPKGHIVLNSGFEDTPALIRESVEKLEFKITDRTWSRCLWDCAQRW